jgi:CRP-like cAMP-binding protein
MEKLKAYITQKIPYVQDDLWELTAPLLEEVTLRKKDFLVKKDEVENYIWFMFSGSVRFYIPGEEELTFGFAFENEFVSAYDSFLHQQPCEYCIQALSKVTAVRLSYANLQKMYNEHPQGNLIGRLIAEQLFVKKKNREMSLLTQPAPDRYYSLFDSHPQLIREIPLKFIASFIGITPQALSRIRARFS